MNHIHRVVWSEHRGTFVAVGEATSRRGKRGGGSGALLAGVLMGLGAGAALAQVAPPPNTLPTGGQVARGQASLTSTGNRLDITQTSQQAIINWQSFSIGAGAQVNFMQPGASAVVLNRVLGSDPSSIFGRLNANGQVFILNPNGVLFGSTARVDVGGLVAGTLALGDADFMAGHYRFTAGRGSVVNQGELSARDGGYIALLAPEVRNEGVISATLGTVALASGQAITLQTAGPLSVAVDQGALEALIENKHMVKAEDGRVLISARSSDALQRAVIRNDGSIEAKGVRNVGGVIRLEADVILQTGSIDASSAAAGGGLIEVRALASDGSGSLIASGRIDASGQRGGSVLLTGNAVDLLDAHVNANGAQAGGEVLIGGDAHGRNASVPNALNTTFDARSVVTADATQSGKGGKVIVWADQGTAVLGSVTARGGAQGGEGGFIETSGKHSLNIAGARIDASAPKGANGQWLLDPSDVTVVHGSSGSLASGVFDPGTPSYIGDTEINAALNGGTDVTIQTTAGSGGSGAIVVNGGGDGGGAVAISNTSGGSRGLSLIADGAINIHSGASIAGSSGNALDVSLNAASGSTLSGTIDNSGGTTSFSGSATLYGTIKNGTVSSSDTTVLSSNNGRLDNVTLGGTNLDVSGELHIYNDLTLANGVTVNAGPNNWYFNGQDTGQAAGTIHRLTTPGTATLNLAGTNLNTFSVNGQTLQIEAGVTVQGYGSLNETWGGNTVTNAGNLIANTPGQNLYVFTSNFSNSGSVSATDGALAIHSTSFTNSGTANASGGTLALNATSWSNPGKINADSGTLNLGGTFSVADLTGASHYARTGGSVNITGTLDNTATSVDIGGSGLFGSGGLTTLYGRILNGTVSSSDTTVLSSNNGRLDNVTLGGTNLDVSGELHIYNDLTLANGVTVNAGPNNWYFNGQDTGQAAGTIHRLTTPGTATLNLAGTNLNTFSVNGQTLQIEAGVTVQGYGSLNETWGGNTVTNAGNLIANTPGQNLYVFTSNFSNSGSVSATTGATFVRSNGFVNTGSLSGGGTIAVGTGASRLVNQGSITPGGTGATGTLTISGDLQMATGASLNVELSGTGAGQFDRLAVSGALSGDTGTSGSSFGTLAVAKTNGFGYVSLTGDTFSLLSAGSGVNSGSFDSVTIGRSYVTPSYGATQFSLLAAPRVLTVSADALSKTYGAADPTFTYAVTGFDPATADNASTALGGLLARASGKDVGSYAYGLGSLASLQGYAISLGTGTSFSITPASITLKANNVSKVYDGGLAATSTATVSSGTLFSGDTLTGGAFAFTNKDVGSGNKTVSASGVTVGDGVANSNYNVSYADNTTSTITPYIVSAAGSRSYDATTGVAASSLTLGALVAGETLTLSGSGTAADKNVGTGKTVATGTLLLGNGTGLANNYSLAGSGVNFNIVAQSLAVGGVAASSRAYDATTTAALTGTAVVSALLSDDVSVSGAGAGVFANKNAGTNKAVTVTGYSLGGADASNYSVVQPVGLTANVTAANLAVGGVAVVGRVYDATSTAGLTGTAVVRAFLSDSVTVAGTGVGSFANKNVGTNKAVTVTGYTLSGADASNYSVVQPVGLTA
ncbi:MAG: YDG domain-containing protein, partial [Rhizobacter sp.]